MTYHSALRAAAEALAAAGIDAPRREARLLLAHALGLGHGALPPAELEVDERLLQPLLARRVAREPMAYITGRQGFWTLELEVSPATLIPRADSETLVEAALSEFPDRGRALRVLDLGTGTGCLLLAVLSEFAAASGVGVDYVPAAAALAARNAARLGLAGRAAFVVANWAAPLAGRFDLVLSNPPYIESGHMPGLMPEVALHEPHSALDGGADGLAAYATLIPTLPDLLAPGGRAILELGQGQAAATSALARSAGFTELSTRRDLAGMERALLLQHAPG